jgi:hypothetical protein
MESAETETAYFALLRAREEAQGLRTYHEYLTTEAQRLRRGQAEAAALIDTVDRRYRRVLQPSDQTVTETVTARLALIADELNRLPQRIDAADAFVAACEEQYHALKDAPDVS